jgi:hypothetical protein
MANEDSFLKTVKLLNTREIELKEITKLYRQLRDDALETENKL